MIGEQGADDFPRLLRAFAHLVIARIEAEHDSGDRGVEQPRIARQGAPLHTIDGAVAENLARKEAHRVRIRFCRASRSFEHGSLPPSVREGDMCTERASVVW